MSNTFTQELANRIKAAVKQIGGIWTALTGPTKDVIRYTLDNNWDNTAVEFMANELAKEDGGNQYLTRFSKAVKECCGMQVSKTKVGDDYVLIARKDKGYWNKRTDEEKAASLKLLEDKGLAAFKVVKKGGGKGSKGGSKNGKVDDEISLNLKEVYEVINFFNEENEPKMAARVELKLEDFLNQIRSMKAEYLELAKKAGGKLTGQTANSEEKEAA